MRGILIVLLFLVTMCISAQDYTILNSENNISIPFVTVNFDDGTGTYSNENGMFSIPRIKRRVL